LFAVGQFSIGQFIVKKHFSACILHFKRLSGSLGIKIELPCLNFFATQNCVKKLGTYKLCVEIYEITQILSCCNKKKIEFNQRILTFILQKTDCAFCRFGIIFTTMAPQIDFGSS
jgi:hypothetical protein